MKKDINTDNILEEASNRLPLQLIEMIAQDKGWQIKRYNKDELSIEIDTNFGNIGMFFSWSSSLKLLQISSILDIHIDTYAYPEVYELLSLINEQMLLGHFSIISGTNLPLYRNSILLSDRSNIVKGQIHDLIDVALSATDKYFMAFYELKKGIGAKSALIMAIPECIGSA